MFTAMPTHTRRFSRSWCPRWRWRSRSSADWRCISCSRAGRAARTALPRRLHEFLTFRTFYTERILRALYCITVAGISVYSVVLLFSHFVLALLLFVLGNLIARVVFEYALLLLVLCRNAQEINRKMGPLPGAADEPQEPPVPTQAHAEPPVQPHPQSDAQPPQPPVPPQE